MIDPTTIRTRVEGAIRLAGEDAWLLGYDINDIQALVTASNRPITMRGASQAIKDFDKSCKASPMSIFAGGGRGVELARSEADARARVEQLEETFRSATHGGVLAADAVPYRRDLEGASLTWLRRKLEIAKDTSPRPGGELPRDKEGQCEDCSAFHGDQRVRGKDEERVVCARCALLIGKARGTGEASQSLLEFARDRRIAAVSADGNNFGALFASLTSLEQMAVVSEAVADMFREAHGEALNRNPSMKVLAPVTGGDDIRAFLAPEGVLDYVEALVRGVERRADSAGDLGGVLTKEQKQDFLRIGVGVGAVVAGDHYPASRLMDYAHTLERSAKRICRASTGDNRAGPAGARSAFDFAILTSGEAQRSVEPTSPISGGAQRRIERPSPISMEPGAWTAALRSARALRGVPGAQRAVLAERATLPSFEEFQNLLRYRIARSSEWLEWFKTCDVNWKDDAALLGHVNRVRVDLLDLLPTREHRA